MTGKQLRDSILQWAIQGRLVPQDPQDEPASELLKRIREEKARLIKEKKIKKPKTESTIFRADDGSYYEKLSDGKTACIDEEIPFEVPQGWVWCRLGSVSEIKSSKRVFEKDYVSSGIPFFRSAEIGNLKQSLPIQTRLFISEEHYEKLKENYGVPQEGDLMITSVGTIGNTWISDGRKFYYKDGNITQISKNNHILPEYYSLFINSSLFEEQITNNVSGTAYNALTMIKLYNLLIPLPPLSEQRRIVAKIEEVLGALR